eukprot:SAG31_NODE_40426_length_281_cov_0.516484_1_plen_72_part_01
MRPLARGRGAETSPTGRSTEQLTWWIERRQAGVVEHRHSSSTIDAHPMQHFTAAVPERLEDFATRPVARIVF